MKGKIILSLAALICFSVVAHAQSDAGLNQVTLYGSIGHGHDGSRAGVEFDIGEQGFAGELPAVRIIDLNYGTLMINKNGDWLEARDPRSMIIDLGKRRWTDFKETPPFPKKSQRTRPALELPKVVDASAGSRTVSPYRQFLKAKEGHLYLMRVVRPRRVIFVMFRVDSLKPNDSCAISWKKVMPPKVIGER